MNTPITALSREHTGPKDFRMSRSQREAGIDWRDWESRMKPLRPLWHEIAASLFLAIFIAAVLFF